MNLKGAPVVLDVLELQHLQRVVDDGCPAVRVGHVAGQAQVRGVCQVLPVRGVGRGQVRCLERGLWETKMAQMQVRQILPAHELGRRR